MKGAQGNAVAILTIRPDRVLLQSAVVQEEEIGGGGGGVGRGGVN